MIWHLSGAKLQQYVEQSKKEAAKREKEKREKETSPAWQFMRSYYELTQHCYGSYRTWQDCLISNIEYYGIKEDALPWGRGVIVRIVFLLPQYRGRGLTAEFFRRLTSIAEKTGCLICVCCSPFDLRDHDLLQDKETDQQKLDYLCRALGS